MTPCAHKSRAEAMACPFFRARKAERIAPLHGPNAFIWQLTEQQETIMGSLLTTDPWRVEAHLAYRAIRWVFADADDFIRELTGLAALGLLDVYAPRSEQTAWCSLTEEGREHCACRLAARGTTIAQFRLGIQAQCPTPYLYPAPFVDRVIARLAANEKEQITRAFELAALSAQTEMIQ